MWTDGKGRSIDIQSMSDRWLNNIRKYFSDQPQKAQPILDEIKRRKLKRKKV